MSNQNTPRVDFWILQKQIHNYLSTEPRINIDGSPFGSDREQAYSLEAELTALDFLKDEMRALLNDIDTRSRYLADKLDSGV